MLPITKIYIDSRYKTSDSVSSSDFKVELPETISLPRDTHAYITDITIPNTMTTITKGWNDMFYFADIQQPDAPPYAKTFKCWRLQLQAGHYTAETLAAHLQERLATLRDIAIHFPPLLSPFTVVGNNADNALTFSRPDSDGTMGFRILTDYELRAGEITYNGLPYGDPSFRGTENIAASMGSYDASDPASINYMIKNTGRAGTEYFGNIKAYVCPFLNLQPVRNIYITSPNFGSFDTASVMGISGIIKRVPVSVGYGYLIYTGSSYEPSDFRDVGGLSLKTLYFRLVNSSNKTIDLKGSDVSFSVVFQVSGDVS